MGNCGGNAKGAEGGAKPHHDATETPAPKPKAAPEEKKPRKMVGWKPKPQYDGVDYGDGGGRRAMAKAIEMLSENEWKTTPEIEKWMTENHAGDSPCTAFGIEDWDTSSVGTLESLFCYKYNAKTTTFNGDISKWNTSSCTSMYWMFNGAAAFNGDLSKWDVSKVEDMNCMFADCGFNGDISKWDTSKVKEMPQVFFGRDCKFNGDISQWNLSSLKLMDGMFGYNQTFNTDISNWDVSKVKSAQGVFTGSAFKGDISKWFDGKPQEEWPKEEGEDAEWA